MRRFARFAERVEADLLPQVDLTLTASEADAKRVGEIAPGARVAVYPNVLPFTPIPPQVESGPSIVFSGNFEYLPNVQAIRWFHERIWPQLRRIYPGLRWRLVGSHVEAAPRRVLSDPGVETVAAGADAISILARSSIGIAPIVSGSGTRLKILEMWAAALPVVSTHLGAEGLGARPGVEVLLADDPDQFARCVIELLEEAGRRREIGVAGRRLYEREFTWQAGWKRLESLGI
jgi:glycosyltransferase involved in cell wall biosynthesis